MNSLSPSFALTLSIALLTLSFVACGGEAPPPDANTIGAADAAPLDAVPVDVAVEDAVEGAPSEVVNAFHAFAALVDDPGECVALTICPDGCVDLQDDVANCGACGARCLQGDYCQAGHCNCASDD